MKTIIDQMQRQIAQQQAADDALVGKLKALGSFIDRAAQSRKERDDAVIAAIREDQAAFLGELRTIQGDIATMIRDIQGPGHEIEHKGAAQLQAAG